MLWALRVQSSGSLGVHRFAPHRVASTRLRSCTASAASGPGDRAAKPMVNDNGADAELKDSPTRKRKMQTSAGASSPPPSKPAKVQPQKAADAASPSSAGAASTVTASGAPEPVPELRGMPLAQFVGAWEFRWDKQMKEYPWEWGGDLSDGPYNIIRYGQPPPKNWRRT